MRGSMLRNPGRQWFLKLLLVYMLPLLPSKTDRRSDRGRLCCFHRSRRHNELIHRTLGQERCLSSCWIDNDICRCILARPPGSHYNLETRRRTYTIQQKLFLQLLVNQVVMMDFPPLPAQFKKGCLRTEVKRKMSIKKKFTKFINKIFAKSMCTIYFKKKDKLKNLNILCR